MCQRWAQSGCHFQKKSRGGGSPSSLTNAEKRFLSVLPCCLTHSAKPCQWKVAVIRKRKWKKKGKRGSYRLMRSICFLKSHKTNFFSYLREIMEFSLLFSILVSCDSQMPQMEKRVSLHEVIPTSWKRNSGLSHFQGLTQGNYIDMHMKACMSVAMHIDQVTVTFTHVTLVWHLYTDAKGMHTVFAHCSWHCIMNQQLVFCFTSNHQRPLSGTVQTLTFSENLLKYTTTKVTWPICFQVKSLLKLNSQKTK